MTNLGGAASDKGKFYFANQARVILEREQQPPGEREPYEIHWNRIFDVDRPDWKSEMEYPSTSSFEWESWNSDTEATSWVREHFPHLHVGDEFWGGIDCVGSKDNKQYKPGIPNEIGRIFYFIEIKSAGWRVDPGWRVKRGSAPSTKVTIGLNQLNEYQNQLRELKTSGLPGLNEREQSMQATSAFFYYLLMYTQRKKESIAGRQVYLVRPEHMLYGADGKPRNVAKGRRGGMVSVSRARLNEHVAAGNLVQRVDTNTVFDGAFSLYTPAHGSYPEFSLMPIARHRMLLRTSIEDAFSTPKIEEPKFDPDGDEVPW